MKPFETLPRSVKIKISLNFFSSFGIGTERFNMYFTESESLTVHN